MSVPTAEPASVSRARVSEEDIVEAYNLSLRYIWRCAPPRLKDEAMEASGDAAVVWLKAVASGKYDPSKAKLSTYACRIAVRILWRRLEKVAAHDARHVSLSPGIEPAARATAKPSRWKDDEWRKEALAALENAMNGLSMTAQQIVTGRYFHHCTLFSLAYQLNITPESTRQILFRARLQLARDPHLRSFLVE